MCTEQEIKQEAQTIVVWEKWEVKNINHWWDMTKIKCTKYFNNELG